MSKENEGLQKEMININSQLQQRKGEIARKVMEHNILKGEIKITKKEQIQQKQKEKTFRTLKIQKKLKENQKNKMQH